MHVYVMSLATTAEWEAECDDPSIFECGAESLAAPQFVGIFGCSGVAMAKGMEEAEDLAREQLDEDVPMRWEHTSGKHEPGGRDWWKGELKVTVNGETWTDAFVVVQKEEVQ